MTDYAATSFDKLDLKQSNHAKDFVFINSSTQNSFLVQFIELKKTFCSFRSSHSVVV